MKEGNNTENRAMGHSRRQRPYEFRKKLCKLTIAGGFAFWVTTIATSLLPIAAKYRAAFSNWSMQTVLIGSLFAGIVIGCCVSYSLLRFFAKIPAKNPILISVILSSISLVIAIILIDIPMILHVSSGTLYYFFVGVVFNAVRFLLLGITVGYLYKRLYS
jgi:hypothetical protein